MEANNKKTFIRNAIIIAVIFVLVLIVFIVKQIDKKENSKQQNNLLQGLNLNNMENNENNIEYIEKDNIINEIETMNKKLNDNYILYNFGYEGCYYCSVMEPIFNKYKNSYDNIEFKEVDIYESTELAQKYNVLYTPTFIIVDDNEKQVDKIVGAVSEEKFKQFVEKYK